MKVLSPLFDWLQERATGALLHPTSLPGDTGIGTFGKGARRFVDLLHDAGIRYWQICPLGPTGYGDSPYQSFSAFAGNPYLIDLHTLAAEHVLNEQDLLPLQKATAAVADAVDYGMQWELRWPVLRLAADRFLEQQNAKSFANHPAAANQKDAFNRFCKQNADWLEPYVLYTALKRHYNGHPWYEWPKGLRTHTSALELLGRIATETPVRAKRSAADTDAVRASAVLAAAVRNAAGAATVGTAAASARKGRTTAATAWAGGATDTEKLTTLPSTEALAAIHEEAARQRVLQFWFARQWEQLRAYAAERSVQIIGDIPIFVSLDSADVWARPELYELDAAGRPSAVAGVPPDYFSPKGQLWGNPLYRWERHAADDYAWWHSRLRHAFSQFDVVRIDHFRGFDTYWRIPAKEQDARRGKWIKGPGLPFFESIARHFPDCRLIAEDLGDLSQSVRDLRAATGLPGMAILQFAFGDADSAYLPHNLEHNCILYPGTHDNDTSVGWYDAAPLATRDHMRRYLGVNGENTPWDFIRCGYASVCRLFVAPLQDFLSLGTQARFNVPGEPAGNWQWRVTNAQLEAMREDSAEYLQQLKELYRR